MTPEIEASLMLFGVSPSKTFDPLQKRLDKLALKPRFPYIWRAGGCTSTGPMQQKGPATCQATPPEVLQWRYDVKTGMLFWRQRPVEMFADWDIQCRPSLQDVERKSTQASPRWWRSMMGILRGTFSGRKSARIAPFGPWSWVWPEGEVDHRNGDPKDNRLENLRPAGHRRKTAGIKSRARRTRQAQGR